MPPGAVCYAVCDARKSPSTTGYTPAMNLRKNMSAIRTVGLGVAAATLWASAGPAWGQAAWWNQAFVYRRAVTVPSSYKPTRLGGDDIAVVTMPTDGLT